MDLTNLEDIQSLAALMETHGLSGLELHQGEDRLVLSRGGAPVAQSAAPVAAAPASPAEVAPQGASATAPPDDGSQLTAPLVGNVYLAPAPDKPPYVRAGEAVKKGQTLCIIEAMKVMNELPAPRDGTVTAIHIENEQLVEYGQPLFTLA